jgi:acyl-CoA thioester hydrolase
VRKHTVPAGPFLEARAPVRVRFQEVDSLKIVWHGHYLSYCEEGRLAFGRAYAIGYDDLHAAGLSVPIVHAALDYRSPARFGDALTVRTRLYPSSVSRLAFRYWIERGDEVLAEAFTIQAFLDLEGNLQVVRPEFFQAFLSRWKSTLREESA